MKNNTRKKGLALLLAFIWSIGAVAEITPGELQQLLSDKKFTTRAEVTNLVAVKEFYTRLSYQTVWIKKENKSHCDIFLDVLNRSAALGLRQRDYQFKFIMAFRIGGVRLENMTDSLEAEVRITDAAIHFYNDIAYGNTTPPLGYFGLKSGSAYRNVPVLLADHLLKNILPSFITYLSPRLPVICVIEKKLNWINNVMADTNFREIIIKSNKVEGANKPLIVKLYQLGVIDSISEILPNNTTEEKVKEAQRQFDLPANGVLSSSVLKELNIPLSVRIQQLNLSINYYRWLNSLIQERSVILVNIPAAYSTVYRNDKIILEMRMIVGKKSTPTPTLASTVDEVVLYPYWHVPKSIATKELLPAIKRNPGYINAGNYQVLNREGKIIDPYSVNWHALSREYFPYIIRQSTGCDNSLGLLKLNFYSPFGVYLHDTPSKNLFKLNKRFFSHGCMRMEKPMEMGHLVLKDNHVAIDTLEQKGCLRNQSPITVHADEQMPVIVWYNPVGIDSTGRIVYYEDVYRKFDWMKKK